MPDFPTNPNEHDLFRAYNDGFNGAVRDPNHLAKFLGENPHPLFGAASTSMDNLGEITSLEGSGKGKVVLLYKSLDKFDPTCWTGERQTTGDCTKSDALIRMADGSLKRIEDVKLYERVISVQGNACRVTKLIRKDKSRTGTVTRVTFSNDHTDLVATPDHLILTVIGEERIWKPISKLEKGDLVLRPNPVEEKNTHLHKYDLSNFYDEVITEFESKKTRKVIPLHGYVRASNGVQSVKRYIDLDDKLAWLLGLYAAEGSMDYENDKPSRITLNIGSHRVAHAHQAKQYLEEIFDVKCRLYSVPSKPTVIFVRLQNVIVASLFSKMISGNVYDKKLHKNFFNSPRSVRLAVLRGWMDGDGHITESGRVEASSVSLDLLDGMQALCTSCRINTKASYKPTYGGRRECYKLYLDSEPIWSESDILPAVESGRSLKLAGSLCDLPDGTTASVEGVEEEDYDDEVFCLVVENDHSFISDGYGVHNCVSHAVRKAVDGTRAVEIDILGEAESFLARGATEPIYGCRGHKGQGMSCSVAAKWVSRKGGYLLRLAYPDLDIDLSKYDAKIGTGWGRKGVPGDIKQESNKHQVKTASLITSVEEARDAIANGYCLAVCSSQGFSNQRDDQGFARPKGSWSHGMAWMGVDDSSSRPGFLVCNSWGKWNSGPKRHDQPDGSFWIDYDVAAKMIARRGTWAFSSFDGFPPKELPNYLLGVFG